GFLGSEGQKSGHALAERWASNTLNCCRKVCTSPGVLRLDSPPTKRIPLFPVFRWLPVLQPGAEVCFGLEGCAAAPLPITASLDHLVGPFAPTGRTRSDLAAQRLEKLPNFPAAPPPVYTCQGCRNALGRWLFRRPRSSAPTPGLGAW